LTKHGVHQGCFPMVNVGDDGYVSQTVVYGSMHDSNVLCLGLTGGGKILPRTRIANFLTKINW